MMRIAAEQEESLRRLIRGFGLQAVEDLIVERTTLCYSLSNVAQEDYSRIGNHRFGGVPDLPRDMEWPTTHGEHLRFLMQINLELLPELNGSPLPADGMLYYFLESDTRPFDVRHRVIYADAPRRILRRATHPDESVMVPCYSGLKPFCLSAEIQLQAPPYRSSVYAPIGDAFRRHNTDLGIIGTHDFEMDVRYISRRTGHAGEAIPVLGSIGQLLGYQSDLNGDITLHAQITTAGRATLLECGDATDEELMEAVSDAEKRGDKEKVQYYRKAQEDKMWYDENRERILLEKSHWRLLCEIVSDWTPSFCVWDSGSYEIMIDERKLRDRDFSNTYGQVLGI